MILAPLDTGMGKVYGCAPAFTFLHTSLGGATTKCWSWKYGKIGGFRLPKAKQWTDQDKILHVRSSYPNASWYRSPSVIAKLVKYVTGTTVFTNHGSFSKFSWQIWPPIKEEVDTREPILENLVNILLANIITVNN